MPETTSLPEPQLRGPMSLEETLLQRRSVRSFTDEPLDLTEISQLLWAAQGITDPGGYRTAPSAGALYPLEVYVVTQQGVYHYDPATHALEVSAEGDLRRDLYAMALQQESVLEAPATIVITAVYARVEVRYGHSRTPRYVHMEAGHAAQNVLLQAVALDLGGVPVGAFDDRGVQSVLGLPSDRAPLYLIPVGHPR